MSIPGATDALNVDTNTVADMSASSSSPTALAAQGTSTGPTTLPPARTKNLYHCDYCRADISNVVRISCAVCTDFDLCLSCFSKGVRLDPHEPYHAYRIIEQTKIPLYDKAWGADEELLLLDAIETCGFGNWTDIADQIGTKNKQQCEYHYNAIYLNSKTAPLPDPEKAIVTIKNSQSQQTSTASSPSQAQSVSASPSNSTSSPDQNGVKPESSEGVEQGMMKMEIDQVKQESGSQDTQMKTENNANQLKDESSVSAVGPFQASPDSSTSPPTPLLNASQTLTAPIDSKSGRKSKNTKIRNAKPAQPQSASGLSADSAAPPIAIGGHKPLTTWKPAPAKPVSGLAHLVGYIPARGDFDTEFDQDAEQMLADMEFLPTDTPWETELKLKVLSIYNSKLDARAERKKFIIERGFLERKDKKRQRDEKEIANNVRCFARFHTHAQHEEFITGLTREARLRKKIDKLQQARLNGCRTLDEAERFEQSRAMQMQSLVQPVNTSVLSSQTFGLQNPSMTRGPTLMAGTSLRPSGQSGLAMLPPFAIDMCKDVELLSDREKALCVSLHLLPHHYMQLKHRLLREAATRGWLKEGQPRSLIQVNVNKTKQLVDFFVQAGWTNTQQIASQASMTQQPMQHNDSSSSSSQ